MALLLDLWTALILGILYLAFEAWPFIFIDKHGFDLQQNGLACIGLGVGMCFGCALNIWIIMYVLLSSTHQTQTDPATAGTAVASRSAASSRRPRRALSRA